MPRSVASTPRRRGGAGQPARAPRARIQLVVQPQVRAGVGVARAYQRQRARVPGHDHAGGGGDAPGAGRAAPGLGAVVLYHERLQRIGHACQGRLAPAHGLSAQGARVVRLPTHRIVEQDRAHFESILRTLREATAGCAWRVTVAYRRALSPSTKLTVSKPACVPSASATKSSSSTRIPPTARAN